MNDPTLVESLFDAAPMTAIENPATDSEANESPQPIEPVEVPRTQAEPLHDRVLLDLGDPTTGPTLIVIGGLHGNEPAGVRGIERVAERLRQDGTEITGRLLCLIGNRRALNLGRRFLVDDLNRIWTRQRIERVKQDHEDSSEGLEAEDAEQLELNAVLENALTQAHQTTYALDFHTTSGPGSAFTVLDDTLANRSFGLALKAPLVLGIEEELVGTLANHLSALGVVTIGFEGGQHVEEVAIDRCEAALWIALATTGLLGSDEAADRRPEVVAARERLERDHQHLPQVVEVRYRHAIALGDEFRMRPNYVNFGAVEAGQAIADDRNGPITVRKDGLILMPLYQEQGEDGFFLIRPVAMSWLKLSARARRMRLERFLHWLPGVRRHPELDGTFIINRRIARWFALEIFHLLGFRRHALVDNELLVGRRAHDA